MKNIFIKLLLISTLSNILLSQTFTTEDPPMIYIHNFVKYGYQDIDKDELNEMDKINPKIISSMISHN